jgi:phosphopantothenoylcysteine decarboxylase/phosphopantothenate--cysteine ligase
MSVLSGKKIILGVSGGIAAYKSALLVRLFIKAGAEVQVIMTPASKDFVTPLTLSTLSKKPVYSTFFDTDKSELMWNNHVELALWADYIVVAPATANTISKMITGNCDNLLLGVYLSAKCPVYIAPAMDLDMYKHDSTISNFNTIKQFGTKIIPAETGELASGLSGEGRMAEPENIITFLEQDILQTLPLVNKKILITAGPTYEAIDPVRFIGNHSTGKMGYDIAIEAANMGASVTLLSGPTHLSVQHSNIKLIRVTSADEMYNACHQFFIDADVMIAAAAVADYRPKYQEPQKIKKNEPTLTLELEKTKDILESLGKIKKNQFLVGFALETENEIANAMQKIKKKNLNLIVLNSLNDKGAGFGTKTNKITFINDKFVVEPKELKLKEQVAQDIVAKIITHYA